MCFILGVDPFAIFIAIIISIEGKYLPSTLLINPPQFSPFLFFKFNPTTSSKLNQTNKNMGLSPYSTPFDAGLLCLILINTAISISMMKEFLHSILNLIRIHPSSSSSEDDDDGFSDEVLTDDAIEWRGRPSKILMDEFRSRIPTVRFDSLSCTAKQECSVCLTVFKPDAEINRLSCGHVFHRSCLEKWFKYWNLTCPLCRNQMITLIETQENTCPM